MIYSIEHLKQDLISAGISAGDTLLVHSSMKSIGSVESGAEGVFRALMDVITDDGLLIFPTLSYEAVSEQTPDFNEKTTPSCTGILPELFRKKKNVFRSLHPFHSLAAWGRAADAFVHGHERFETAFDMESPWGKLLDRNAKVFLIGVDLTAATFLHPVEQWSGVPVLSETPVLRYIVHASGEKTPRTIYWHTGAHSENYFRAESVLSESGALRKVRFGAAESLLMDCRKTYQVMKPILEKNPLFFAHHG